MTLTPEHRAELRRALHYSGQPNFAVERDTIAALLDAADELDPLRERARSEEVKRVKAEHRPFRVRKKTYCRVDEREWPCPAIRALDEADDKSGSISSDTGGTP